MKTVLICFILLVLNISVHAYHTSRTRMIRRSKGYGTYDASKCVNTAHAKDSLYQKYKDLEEEIDEEEFTALTNTELLSKMFTQEQREEVDGKYARFVDGISKIGVIWDKLELATFVAWSLPCTYFDLIIATTLDITEELKKNFNARVQHTGANVQGIVKKMDANDKGIHAIIKLADRHDGYRKTVQENKKWEDSEWTYDWEGSWKNKKYNTIFDPINSHGTLWTALCFAVGGMKGAPKQPNLFANVFTDKNKDAWGAAWGLIASFLGVSVENVPTNYAELIGYWNKIRKSPPVPPKKENIENALNQINEYGPINDLLKSYIKPPAYDGASPVIQWIYE